MDRLKFSSENSDEHKNNIISSGAVGNLVSFSFKDVG